MTEANGIIGDRFAARRSPRRPIPPPVRVKAALFAPAKRRTVVSLLALAGAVVPSEVQVSLAAGARFTPGRIAIVILLFPALFALFQKGRKLLACDYFLFATVCWMIIASLSASGTKDLSSAGGDALDLFGGYIIARGYLFGLPALNSFVRVLKLIVIIVVVFGMADSLSGRLIVHETFGAIAHTSDRKSVV